MAALGLLGVLAASLVAAPPAAAASSSDVHVNLSVASTSLTVGTPAKVLLLVGSFGPDTSGPTTVQVTATGAAATLTAAAKPDDNAASTCSVVGRTVTCTNAGLGGGDQPYNTAIPLVLTPTASGTVTLTATISAAATDPYPSNNADSVPFAAAVATAADIAVTAWGLGGYDTLVRGGDVPAMIEVSSWGPSASGAVAVHITVAGAGSSLTLPPGYDDGRGTTCSRPTATTVDCTVPTLSEAGLFGYQTSIPLRVAAASTGTVTLTATGTGPLPDPDPASNTATDSTTVAEAPAATVTIAAAADLEQGCGYDDDFRGIAASGRLSVPAGTAAYQQLVVTAVPDTAGPTLTRTTTTDGTGAWDALLCGAATTGHTVTVRNPGTPQAGPASASARVLPRATTIAVVPSPAGVVYGGQVELVATVRDAASSTPRPALNAVAVVERRAPGTSTWSPVKPLSSNIDQGGAWRVTFAPTASTEYRVRYPEQGLGALGAVSAPVLVAVRAKAALAASPHVVTPGGTVTVTGSAVPAAGAAPVLERLVRGAWTAVAVRPSRVAGKATWTLRLPSAGTSTYRVRVPESATLAAGLSATTALTATLKGKGNPKAFTFVGGTRANPARWNPCQVITYRVNTRYAKPGAVADVAEALRRISQYSGLRFRYAGTTSYLPSRPRGAMPAPLVIAWAPGSVDPSFRSPYLAGYASPAWYDTSRPRIFRAGVMLNAGMATPAGFGLGFTRGILLMHELAHAVGLGHVDDRYSVMQPVANPPGDSMYSAGDAAGLRRLGRSAGCLSALEPLGASAVTTTLR